VSLLKLRYMGDPVLRQKSRPVENIDGSHAKLFQDMVETMYHNRGIGLAAPQIGVSERIIVLDQDPEEWYGKGGFVVINPLIREADGEEEMEEGCLSIPEIRDVVKRAYRLVVVGYDLDGREIEIDARGLMARAFQHEIDHINGVLFLDRLGAFQRDLHVRKWRKIRKELERTG
jgi:peptide deformylase